MKKKKRTKKGNKRLMFNREVAKEDYNLSAASRTMQT
jgi:hypothetical protein